MFSALLPKSAPFFRLLLEQNEILCTVAKDLSEIVEDHTLIDQLHLKITALEAKADMLQITITKQLSQTFITPIDREDILHINKAQEEAIDLIHDMANRLYIFEFSSMRFAMKRLASTLNEMVLLTRDMLEGLSRKKDCHNTREFLTLKNECEMLLSMGLGELHDLKDPTPADILNILKWNQAYDRMEMAVEQVIELAETIEEALLKNV